MKGNAPNVTTCADACVDMDATLSLMTNLYTSGALNVSVSATLNYFRCYIYENGNNENVDNITLSSEDAQCDPGITFLYYPLSSRTLSDNIKISLFDILIHT